jgi:cytochrome c-type biogenesis protein CcmH
VNIKMSRLVLLLLLLVCLFVPAAIARDAQPLGEDPAVEARLNKLSKELRCLVCRNETLAESPAGLADDLRREIREQIRAGKSDREIVAFLQARYGEYILYRPRVTPTTYLLWFGPFVLLLGGLAFLFRYIKQRRDSITEQPLTDDDRRRAEKLLAATSGKETV